MLAFRVLTFQAAFRSTLEAGKQIGFRNVVNILSLLERRGPEALTIVLVEQVFVRVEPCLHRLDHEVELILRSAAGPLPPLAVVHSDMLPRVSVGNWCLAVH